MRRAFTIIELLIVLGIIAIALTWLLVAINPAKRLAEGRNAVRLNDVTAIKAALERYADQLQRWPEGLAAEFKPICRQGVAPQQCATNNLLDLSSLTLERRYLQVIPSDPSLSADSLISGYEAALINQQISVRAAEAELGFLINSDIGSPCLPNCSGKNCGSDGCGGSCGNCAGFDTCGGGGQPDWCGCSVQCVNRCGGIADGCGGSCPLSCNAGQVCLADNTCCQPNCLGKICGSDGCGGSCGNCASGKICSNDQSACITPLANAFQIKHWYTVPRTAVIANNDKILVNRWGTLTGNDAIQMTTDGGASYTVPNTAFTTRSGQHLFACDDDCSSMASITESASTKTLAYSFNGGSSFATRNFTLVGYLKKILLSNAANNSNASRVLLVPDADGYLMRATSINGTLTNIGSSRIYNDAAISGDGNKICATAYNDRYVYCSDNGGSSFYTVDTGTVRNYEAIDMSDNGQVVALYYNSSSKPSLLLTINRFGSVATWNVIDLPTTTQLSLASGCQGVDVSADGSTITVPAYDVYRSVDYGNNWSKIKSFEVGSNNQPRCFSASRDASRLLFSSLAYSYLQKSSDGGATWAPLGIYSLETQHYATAVSADGQTIFSGGLSSGVYKSSNGGNDFTSITDSRMCVSPNYCNPISKIDISGSGGKLAGVYTGNYLLFSLDGGATVQNSGLIKSWQDAAINYDGSQAVAANCNDSSNGACTSGYLYKSGQSLNDWQALTAAGSLAWMSVDLDDSGQNLVAAESSGQAYYSRDGGQSWQASAMPSNNNDYGAIRAIRSDSSGRYVMMIRAKGVLKSGDYGQTFSPGIANNSSLDFRSGTVCRNGLMVAGGFMASNNLAYSADYGQTWLYKTVSPIPGFDNIDCSESGSTVVVGHYQKDYLTIYK